MRHPRILIMALALIAAGCSNADRDLLNETFNPFAEKGPKPACPSINLLADASSVTRFRPGPGEDLTDVLFDARVSDLGVACNHDIDDDTRTGTLAMELQMVIEANRGPADRTRQAPVDYFITLTDSNRKILDKRVFDMSASFPDNRTRAVVMDDPVEMEIPLAAGQTGGDFRIYVGFQLTQRELEYNRRRRQLTGR